MTSEKGAQATFGAGCFWGVEARFAALEGVLGTAVGYMGGSLEKPSYQDVCRGDSGHTEVVQVQFDPSRIDYVDLLDAFFSMHDPTQVNRQGPDHGFQYRSVIFHHDPEQQARAEQAVRQLAATTPKPIATAIEPAARFWRAEEYHQQYLKKSGASCNLG